MIFCCINQFHIKSFDFQRHLQNSLLSVDKFCIKTFDSQVKAEELTLGDIVEIKFGDR